MDPFGGLSLVTLEIYVPKINKAITWLTDINLLDIRVAMIQSKALFTMKMTI